MKVTVIGAGNSGLAMAAHISMSGHEVTLWNRSYLPIETLMQTKKIYCTGEISGEIDIHCVTDDISIALQNPDLVLITTPASSHKELARLVAENIGCSCVIVLNPGRTFGALEFEHIYKEHNTLHTQIVAETQTIIYTCRKTASDAVNIIAFKDSVLIHSSNTAKPDDIIQLLPTCLRQYFVPAKSMIETSIGNVGMILHCAPMILNCGWLENTRSQFKYYRDGITPTIASFIEQIDRERVLLSTVLGHTVESAIEWMKRTYHVDGETLYECVQNNTAYETIDAPKTLHHRYILEDIPCGLVPLEAVGLKLGLTMCYTSLVIEMASRLMKIDFRAHGRNLNYLDLLSNKHLLETIMGKEMSHG